MTASVPKVLEDNKAAVDADSSAAPARPQESPAPVLAGLWVIKAAAYGSIGVGALAGWSVRFFLKYIFTHQLAVTGSAGVREGGAVHADLMANMLGAFVFGLLSKNEALLKPWHPAIFVGIGTGFCGSCTTFSSWMVEAGVQMWVPLSTEDPLSASQLVRGVLLIFVGLMCLLSALHMGQEAGARVALMVQRRIDAADVAGARVVVVPEFRKPDVVPDVVPVPLHQGKEALLCWLFLVSVWAAVVGLLLSASAEEAEGPGGASGLSIDLLAGMCFAPLGAWLRFELSKFNVRFPNFPAFTLAANLLGTMLSIACWCIAMEIEPEANLHLFLRSRTWIVAVSGGFCGCLSTASTFANELHKLSRAKGELSENALKYGLVSILSAQAVVAVVVNAYVRSQ